MAVFWFVWRIVEILAGVLLIIATIFVVLLVCALVAWMWDVRPRARRMEWYCTHSGWTKAEILNREHCCHDGPCPMDIREI